MTLVSTEWLNNNLSKVKIFDASWHMFSSKRDAKKEYSEKHIPSAMFWNLDEHSDKDSPYPHMMPNSDYWTRMLQKFGITNDDHIIVYDYSYQYSSCRLWFALKYFGHEKVSILNCIWDIIVSLINKFSFDLSIIHAKPNKLASFVITILEHSKADLPVVMTSSTIKTLAFSGIEKPRLNVNLLFTLSQKIVSFFNNLPIS